MEDWDWRWLGAGLGRKLHMVLLLRLFGWAGWGLRSFGRVGRRLDVGLIGVGEMDGVGEGGKWSNDAGELWEQVSLAVVGKGRVDLFVQSMFYTTSASDNVVPIVV
jgi:hypothetical protein